MLLRKNETVVFIGDSVTDDGRARPVGERLSGLGNGYVRLIDCFLEADYPEYNIRTVNMGISGNTTADLLARWDDDVTARKPTTVVLCIGFNDVWRQFDSPMQPEYAVTPEQYRANLNTFADKTSAKMIWMTPYYLEPNTDDAMRKRMDEYGAIGEEAQYPLYRFASGVCRHFAAPLFGLYHVGPYPPRAARQPDHCPRVFKGDRRGKKRRQIGCRAIDCARFYSFTTQFLR